MSVIICPGIHQPELTENFVSNCLEPITDKLGELSSVNILVYPGKGVVNLSGVHLFKFLCDSLGNRRTTPVVFISFSAGVVGAIVAAMSWHILGGKIKAFIAIDGWGVPLWGDFPIHRISHDYFTHWSSKMLGSGHNNFYAEPAVEHLQMWREPQSVQGWWVDSPIGGLSANQYLSLTQFLYLLLQECDTK
ncbi:MAG: hypothetical protein QNJ51_05325 [Calothrix sp. MO_167.B12]|nr:hypothetical protein [Calothrix sp. MO_167.B12]